VAKSYQPTYLPHDNISNRSFLNCMQEAALLSKIRHPNMYMTRNMSHVTRHTSHFTPSNALRISRRFSVSCFGSVIDYGGGGARGGLEGGGDGEGFAGLNTQELIWNTPLCTSPQALCTSITNRQTPIKTYTRTRTQFSLAIPLAIFLTHNFMRRPP
jgi:hypothetical protein